MLTPDPQCSNRTCIIILYIVEFQQDIKNDILMNQFRLNKFENK